MTGTWFECKVRYAKMTESGNMKKVTECYVVDALSFSEAEARIIKEVSPMISGEYEITGIKRANYTEAFGMDNGIADRWYKAKVLFITVNDNGVEKKTAVHYIVKASGMREALECIEDNMSDTMLDYEIASITDTDIMDVYPYEADRSKSDSPLDMILPEGQSTEVVISNKVYVIDKTGGTTKVTLKETDYAKDKRGSQSENQEPDRGHR